MYIIIKLSKVIIWKHHPAITLHAFIDIITMKIPWTQHVCANYISVCICMDSGFPNQPSIRSHTIYLYFLRKSNIYWMLHRWYLAKRPRFRSFLLFILFRYGLYMSTALDEKHQVPFAHQTPLDSPWLFYWILILCCLILPFHLHFCPKSLNKNSILFTRYRVFVSCITSSLQK